MQRLPSRPAKLPEQNPGAIEIALKNGQAPADANAKASSLAAQAQAMTGLKPGELAREIGAVPSTLWKDANGIQDMGALKRLISMLELITTRGDGATFNLGDMEIVVRGKAKGE